MNIGSNLSLPSMHKEIPLQDWCEYVFPTIGEPALTPYPKVLVQAEGECF